MATSYITIPANTTVKVLTDDSGRDHYRQPITSQTVTPPFNKTVLAVGERRWDAAVEIELNDSHVILDDNNVTYVGGHPTGR